MRPGQALLNLFPLPNTLRLRAYNYTSQLPGASPRRETLLRAGLQPDGQYPRLRPLDRRPAADGGALRLVRAGPDAADRAVSPTRFPARSFAAGATWIISPTMTNEFNWGFTHNSILIDEDRQRASTRTTSGVNSAVAVPQRRPERLHSRHVSFNGTRIAAQPAASARAMRRSSTTTPPSTSATT